MHARRIARVPPLYNSKVSAQYLNVMLTLPTLGTSLCSYCQFVPMPLLLPCPLCSPSLWL